MGSAAIRLRSGVPGWVASVSAPMRRVQRRAVWLKGFIPSMTAVPEQQVAPLLRERGWLVGTPDQLGDQLRAWSDVGVERVMLQYFDLDDMEGLTLLAHVASAVA